MVGIFLLALLASTAYAALTSSPATATRVAAVPPLAEWVASQGGDVSVVQAADAAQLGVGLVAARAVRRGDRLLSVPEELAITAESALRSELLGAYLVEFEPYLADYSFIAVALLNEERLGEQSSLAPWLSSACWQVEQHDLPLLWPSDDQAELEQSTAAPCVERRLAAQADYEWCGYGEIWGDMVHSPRVAAAWCGDMGRYGEIWGRLRVVRSSGSGG